MKIFCWISIWLTSFGFGTPLLNEFLSSNGNGLLDEDGDRSDWIEIYNPDQTLLDLQGYHLTDSDDLTQWTFPEGVTIPPGGYLVVFASDKNRAVAGRQLHTNFKLDPDGDYLALVDPDGRTIIQDFGLRYPSQREDRSYGLSGQREAFFDLPTPGQANATATIAGPTIQSATREPEQPVVGDLRVTAIVREVNGPIQSVSLIYRRMFAAEVVVLMKDDGVAPDFVAEDGVFSALIPKDQILPGQMVRWRFEAVDVAGAKTNDPPFFDPIHSPKYYGTVGYDETRQTNLTTLHWFIENPAQAESSYPSGNPGAPGALYYLGQFYDNVGFKRHGQSTGGFPKKSFNIDFNKGNHFQWNEDSPRVSDIDLLTNWADKSKVRHVLSYEIMRRAGVHAHFAFTVRVEQNGQFYSLADFVEDADETYLKRSGLNKEGALYKVYDNTLNKDSGDSANSGFEKKTRKEETSRAELQALIDGLDLTGVDLTHYQFDHLDLPKIINMLAVNSVIRNIDMHRKNWYLYQDTGQSDEWAILPWDLDLSFGRYWRQPERYFSNLLETGGYVQTGGAIRLVSQIFSNPTTREMYYRRLRTLLDTYLQDPATPVEERFIEGRLNEFSALLDDPNHFKSDAQQDFEKWGSWLHGGGGARVSYNNPSTDIESMAEGLGRLRNEYLPARRNYIYNTQIEGKGGNIPLSQKTTQGFVYTPLIGPQEEVRYYVPTDDSAGLLWLGFLEPYDDSAWLTGLMPLGYERQSGYENVIKTDVAEQMTSNPSIYIRIPFDVEDPSQFDSLELRMKYDDGFFAVLNGTILLAENSPASPKFNSVAEGGHEADVDRATIFDLSSRLSSLKAGRNILAIQGFNDGVGSSDFLLSAELYGGASFEVAPTQPSLEIGKIEVSPSSGNQDEEYIEIHNPYTTAIDVSNWRLADAVSFTFQPGTVIASNSSLFVSPEVSVFRARQDSPKGNEGVFVQGPYAGHLSNRGETIQLIDDLGQINDELTYSGDPSEVQRYLRVSELVYRPSSDGLAEFIELINISDSVTLDLEGVRFTEGIEFDFTDSKVSSLGPGEHVLVVRHQASFEGVYGMGLPVAGIFANETALSNSSETLKLEDADNNTVFEFSYFDEAPWPEAADRGYSLVLVNPSSQPDLNNPQNWRESAVVGGTPGGDDGRPMPVDPLGDADNNGRADLLDYTMGNDQVQKPIFLSVSRRNHSTPAGIVSMPTIEYPRDVSADQATMEVQYSTDLIDWHSAESQLVSVEEQDLGGGRRMLTRYFDQSGARVYFRLFAKAR